MSSKKADEFMFKISKVTLVLNMLKRPGQSPDEDGGARECPCDLRTKYGGAQCLESFSCRGDSSSSIPADRNETSATSHQGSRKGLGLGPILICSCSQYSFLFFILSESLIRAVHSFLINEAFFLYFSLCQVLLLFMHLRNSY